VEFEVLSLGLSIFGSKEKSFISFLGVALKEKSF